MPHPMNPIVKLNEIISKLGGIGLIHDGHFTGLPRMMPNVMEFISVCV